MGDIDVVTVSSRGQVAIPAAVRREMDLEEGAKLLVVSSDDTLLMKKVDDTFVDRSLRDILEPMWRAATDAGVSDADAEELVDEHRQEG